MEVGWSEVRSPTWATALEPAVRALSGYLLGFTSFCANRRQGYGIYNARLNRKVDSVQFLSSIPVSSCTEITSRFALAHHFIRIDLLTKAGADKPNKTLEECSKLTTGIIRVQSGGEFWGCRPCWASLRSHFD